MWTRWGTSRTTRPSSSFFKAKIDGLLSHVHLGVHTSCGPSTGSVQDLAPSDAALALASAELVPTIGIAHSVPFREGCSGDSHGKADAAYDEVAATISAPSATWLIWQRCGNLRPRGRSLRADGWRPRRGLFARHLVPSLSCPLSSIQLFQDHAVGVVHLEASVGDGGAIKVQVSLSGFSCSSPAFMHMDHVGVGDLGVRLQPDLLCPRGCAVVFGVWPPCCAL